MTTTADSTTRMPPVSVVMPCHNAAPFIAGSIRSVLDQDYAGRLELLVVDDGSTDDSVRIASDFARVRVLTQGNQGPAAARNLALRHATGELVAFLDADDLWVPGSLHARVECLQRNPDVSVIFGNFMRWRTSSIVGEADEELPDKLPGCVAAAVESGWLYPEILLDPILHIITAVLRREVIDTVGHFDTQLRTGEDYDFWIRVAQRFRFKRLDRIVARYRLHPGGTTRVPRAEHNEYLVVLRAIESFGLVGHRGEPLDQRLLAKRMQRMCFDHAYSHFWAGDPRLAAAGFRRAIRYEPLSARAWAYALISAGKASLSGSALKKRSTI